MDPDLVRRIVEAALLASPQPLSLAQLAALFPDDAPAPQDSIEQALAVLAEDNGKRGVALVEVASGFRFQVDSALQPWVARLWAERPPRYSRALLETLALIAYRQPITRGEIEQIRGVAVSTHIVKTLEEREWIRVVGHRDVPGRPALFGTTRGFLDYFGLRTLDQLPPLTELQDLPDLEPELPLEGIAQLAAPEPGSAQQTAAAEVDDGEVAESSGDEETAGDAAAIDAVDSAADQVAAADAVRDEETPGDATTGKAGDADAEAEADSSDDTDTDSRTTSDAGDSLPTRDEDVAESVDEAADGTQATDEAASSPSTEHGADAPDTHRDEPAADDTDHQDSKAGERAGPEQKA